jgi:hypothetical protein
MSDHMDYLARCIGHESYNEYLKSEHWITFSDGMRRKNCYCCGLCKPSLEVHHTTYENLGKELPCDVITVCKSCHLAIHEIAKNKVPLEKAHVIHCQHIKAKNKENAWVSWMQLVNKSKHQSIKDLLYFLIKEKLSDGSKATNKSYAIGLVRKKDGVEKWNRKKYIKYMKKAKNSLRK